MSQFVKKASSKIDKLSDEEILRIIDGQNYELKVRNTILNHSNDAYLLVNSEDRIVYLNSIATELLPVSKRRRYQDLAISKVILNSEITGFMSKFIHGVVVDKTEFFEVDDQITGQRSLSCHAIRLSEIPDSCIFVFRDITFLNRFKEEFRKNESLAQMTTMAAGVAHEIKNPLASISIYLQLLDKMWEKNGSMTREEAKKYLDVVSEEVERINAIAVDFLFAVKPMKVNLKSCSMNEIAQKTLKVVEGELKEKGIALNVHLATSLPKVFADPSLIEQSILNLVKNAMQSMEKNCPVQKITISTFIESDMVKLSVSDTGCGMTEDQMSKIFEPYYTTKSAGTGLGLTVLYKIMKQHGGDVHVSSTVGEGSEFVIQIPVPQTERFRIESIS